MIYILQLIQKIESFSFPLFQCPDVVFDVADAANVIADVVNVGTVTVYGIDLGCARFAS